jgi:radical SAM superfamily enzyme YgiQ (UPF0313 family)
MADVILIQPSIKEFQVLEKTPTLPLSLLSVASFLNQDYNIKIIDQRLNKDWKKELLRELKTNPICVGLTATTSEQIINALKASKIVKNNNDSTKVIWGGTHASLLPRQTLENPNIDIVVKGEAEITFYELVKALEKNKNLKTIKGIWYKENSNIKSNPDRPFLDLNQLPPLPYSIVKIENYTPKRNGKKSIHIETSRGCPNNCAYCYNIPINKCTYRYLSVENTIKNINNLINDYGIEYLWIVDDNYFANKKRAIAISEQIIRNKLDIEWTSFGLDVNTMSQLSINELKILKHSGCNELFLGVESGSQRILNLINKNITKKQVISLNRLLKKIQIESHYFFIYGFPTESINELKETVNLIFTLLKDNNLASIGSFCYTPTPNSPLFNLAIKEGFKPPKNLEEWSIFDRDTMFNVLPYKKTKFIAENLNFLSKFLSRQYAEKKGLYLIRKLYSPVARFRMKNFFFDSFLEKRVYNWVIKQK